MGHWRCPKEEGLAARRARPRMCSRLNHREGRLINGLPGEVARIFGELSPGSEHKKQVLSPAGLESSRVLKEEGVPRGRARARGLSWEGSYRNAHLGRAIIRRAAGDCLHKFIKLLP